MEKHYKILKECVLFKNIKETYYPQLLSCLNAHIKQFKGDEYILLSGHEVNYIGIILSGTIQILKESLSGKKHIVSILKPSNMFAEGIVCTTMRISPVTVQAKGVSEVLFIPYERIIKSCGNSCSFHHGLIQNMMVILGEKNVHLNKKLDILTLKGMREKLAAYLMHEAKEVYAYTFHIPLNRTEMADYLNVSRPSMCRELARMKEECIIDYYGQSFKILNRERLIQCLE